MIPSLRGPTAAIIAACLCLASVRADEPLGPTPRAGLLLLRNGEILRGQVALIGDFYHVTVPGGGIRIQVRDAELFCRDLEEGYRLKQARVNPTQAADHLVLAEWCLRQGLIGYAADELTEAIALEPRHPRIPLVERRINLAVSRPKDPHAEHGQSQTSPSNEELDRLVQSLPAGTMEMFTTTIQPLLLNHCSTAGCHGPAAKDQLRLARTPPSRPPTRRLTQRNLAVAVKMLDREHPEQSPLLVNALQSHGTTKAAPLPQRDTLPARQFENWVLRVAAGREPSKPATVSDALPLLQARKSMPLPPPVNDTESMEVTGSLTSGPGDVTNSIADGEAHPVDQDGPDIDGEPPANPGGDQRPPRRDKPRAQRPLQRGRPVESFVPIDPFDPEIFNRRFFPDGKN